MNVSETRLFRRLQEQAVPDPDVRSLIAVVERIFRECEDRLKSVLRYMPQYTLHDAVHIHRVVDLMGRLIPDRVLSRLQPLEIASLILVAGLHDIGMAPAEDEVRALLELPSDAAEPSIEAVRYRAVRHSHPELLRRQAELRNGGNHNAAGNIEAFFLSEYIRETHAERSRQYVFERHHADLRYRNFAFVHLIADVCFSHTQPIEYLTALPVDQLLGGGEYANFRFIAILLRVADILDFDAERTPQVLFQQLGVRDSVSISEWRKHSAISGWDVRPEYLAYTAQCPDPVIEKSIRDFL
ncbi:HD domain-containing protein, partial [Longimicrobium sp.]|uniref:HD domain-containing protein n=1 Tax=Longimicrobium sp. TaxID=2029185 RepID=UPI002F94C10A